ncbi:MAG: HlyD family secretion protein, partial [Muribaculaceae bacterium]|nr:HlyD family secretion protein [Muribaculaceae bacterium]
MKYRTKKQISYVLSAIVIIGASCWLCSRLFHIGDGEFTDNAEVKMQIVPVNSRVQGFIKEIRFSEYQPVSKGDTLVIIDDSDLRLNLARAKADLQNAMAGHSVANQAVSSAVANVAVSDASISEAKILMEQALTDLNRYEKLLEQEAVTRREYDAVKTDYEAKRARYQTLARQKSATSSVVDVNRSRISQSEAGIELANAMVETAELNLSYTVILAPCSGYCSRKEIQEGQLIQPGQMMLSIIDSGDVWVAANYKETQLKNYMYNWDNEKSET